MLLNVVYGSFFGFFCDFLLFLCYVLCLIYATVSPMVPILFRVVSMAFLSSILLFLFYILGFICFYANSACI